MLGSVGLMIVGVAIAGFSTVYAFYNGSFVVAVVSVAAPAAFLIYKFISHFAKIDRGDWNALLVFTVGAYALCVSPVIIMHILNFIVATVVR